MKKRILALSLSLAMLLGLAIIPATAIYQDATVSGTAIATFATPAGAEVVNGENVAPKIAPSNDMTMIDSFRGKVLTFYKKVNGVATITAPQNGSAATVAKDYHLTDNTFSIIGVGSVASMIHRAVDGDWNTKAQFKTDGKLYNVAGDAYVSGDLADYRYTHLMTFNLGEKKNVEAFGYVIPTNANDFSQAADIYVSDDGVNWTLVAYYDRINDRALKHDYSHYNSSTTSNALQGTAWVDEKGAFAEKNRLYFFDIPDQGAKYVRVAATANYGATNGDFGTQNASMDEATLAGKYAVGVGAYGNTTNINYSQIMVFGGDYVEPAPVATTIAMDGVQTKSIAGTDSFDARFVASVEKDALENASAIKLNFVATYGSEKVEKVITINTVYNSFLAGDDVISADNGEAFALFLLEAIPNGTSVTFTVTPEIVYNDNTSAVGAAATFVFPTV